MFIFTVWSIIYSNSIRKNKIINNLKEYEKKEARK